MQDSTPSFNHLKPLVSSGGKVFQVSAAQEGFSTWRLEIPAGEDGSYRLAQLDDYTRLPRSNFPWRAPVEVSLQARASANSLPGTWGVGLWNHPFSFSLEMGGMRFPALPNCAWFFFASPRNHLSFRDDLPAHGALAATFSSPGIPALLLALAGLAAPLMLVRPTARVLRKAARRFIRQDAEALSLDATAWHTYQISWREGEVSFKIDGMDVLTTDISPQGRLGLVMWIDNQYAALPPSGKVSWGTEANPQPAWVEVRAMQLAWQTESRSDETSP